MFNGEVRLNLPVSTSINEDVTSYNLYPLRLNQLPIITKNIGSYFTPLVDKSLANQGPYVDENNTITIVYNNPIKLQVEAYNSVDVQNGIIVSGSGAQNLRYLWRKDGAVLQPNSRIIINNTNIEITTLIKSDSGAYTVEITNDVGTTISDTLTLDVIELSDITEFYSNLVKNYDGSQNLNAWSETSTQGNQITVKRFANNNKKNILTGIPEQDKDFVGYAYPDHFNESEITDGALKFKTELDINQPFIDRVGNNAILNNGTYFTRNQLQSYINNGSNRVQFYQDVDLSNIKRYTEGSVSGVEGVNVTFKCFVGNSISYFIPKKNKQTTTERVLTDQYCFETELPQPRLLIENEEFVEVVAEDFTTIYIEEYQDSNLLVSHKQIKDPYRTGYKKELITTANGSYETGFLIYNDTTTEPIMKDLPKFFQDVKGAPSNLGQYVALRTLDIKKLNVKTNKIRIRVEFFHNGLQQTQGDSPADLIQNYKTTGIYIIPTWLQDKTSKKKYLVDNYSFGKRFIKKNAAFGDVLPFYGQPRNFITGFVLYAIPLRVEDKQIQALNDQARTI
jgi:hypothetical protein